MQSTRTEYDSMGAIEVPANRYWGAQTERSIHNFPIGVARFKQSPILVESLGILKKCAAQANAELEELPDDIAKLIQEAAQEVIEDRKSTRLNSSHVATSYAVFCLKKKTNEPSS